MSQEYEQILQRYKSRAMPIIDNHRAAVNSFKNQEPSGDLDAEQEPEPRQDRYMNRVWPATDEAWGEAAQDFVREVVELRTALEEKVYGGESPSEHLVGLSSVSDDRLSELMETAAAAGDKKLERAVMLTARQRGLRGIVNRFIERDPDRRAAHEQLIRIPEIERLDGIAKAYKPPRAGPESLRPNFDAQERAALRDQGRESRRSGFFGRS